VRDLGAHYRFLEPAEHAAATLVGGAAGPIEKFVNVVVREGALTAP
jgi:hypothetical protein